MPHFEPLDVVPCDPARAAVFEHGWQSWSQTGTYAGDATSPRAVEAHAQTRNYRPGIPGPASGFQGSPDVDPGWLPTSGDHSAPSMRNALTTGAARQFTHRRWWVNDPDCLIARPEISRRERWATHVRDTAGLISVSDRIRDLDATGREIYHELLNR